MPAPERLSEPVQLGPLDRTELVTFNVRDVGAGYLYTSVQRTVNVSVEIPDRYDVTFLQPLTGPILDALPAAPSPRPTATTTPTPAAAATPAR